MKYKGEYITAENAAGMYVFQDAEIEDFHFSSKEEESEFFREVGEWIADCCGMEADNM